MDESESDMSENKKNENHPPEKPKKRSLVERELETSLTPHLTSPMPIGTGTCSSRYGRAIRHKTNSDFYDTEKAVKTAIQASESPHMKIPPTSPVYKLQQSLLKEISPKKLVDTNLDNVVENIYNANISLSRFGSVEKNLQSDSKLYMRKDLIQSKEKEDSRNATPNSAKKSNTHLSNILERSSEKYDVTKQHNSYMSSVVKALDFDSSKNKRKNSQDKMTVLSKSELFELEAKCQFQIGDVLWARMGTYPFWPCIVTREPDSEMFVRKKLYGKIERDVIHVTFFGDNGRRSWILDSMLRSFQGLAEFEAARDQISVETKKKDPKLYAAFFVSEKKLPLWHISIEEANSLYKAPKRLRIDLLNDLLGYSKTPDKTPGKTPKSSSSKITRTDSDVSLSESLFDSLFSEGDGKVDETGQKKTLDVSEVVTACLDNLATKTGMTMIQKKSHMDIWLQKAKSKTPEKSQMNITVTVERLEKDQTSTERDSRKSKSRERDSSSTKKKKKFLPPEGPIKKPYSFRKSTESRTLLGYHNEHDYSRTTEVSDSKQSNATTESDNPICVINCVESLSALEAMREAQKNISGENNREDNITTTIVQDELISYGQDNSKHTENAVTDTIEVDQLEKEITKEQLEDPNSESRKDTFSTVAVSGEVPTTENVIQNNTDYLDAQADSGTFKDVDTISHSTLIEPEAEKVNQQKQVGNAEKIKILNNSDNDVSIDDDVTNFADKQNTIGQEEITTNKSSKFNLLTGDLKPENEMGTLDIKQNSFSKNKADGNAVLEANPKNTKAIDLNISIDYDDLNCDSPNEISAENEYNLLYCEDAELNKEKKENKQNFHKDNLENVESLNGNQVETIISKVRGSEKNIENMKGLSDTGSVHADEVNTMIIVEDVGVNKANEKLENIEIESSATESSNAVTVKFDHKSQITSEVSPLNEVSLKGRAIEDSKENNSELSQTSTIKTATPSSTISTPSRQSKRLSKTLTPTVNKDNSTQKDTETKSVEKSSKEISPPKTRRRSKALTDQLNAVPSTSKTNAISSTSRTNAVPSTSKIKAVPSSTSKMNAIPSTSKINVTPSTSKINAMPSTSKINAMPSTSKINAMPSTSKINAIPSTSKMNAAPSTSKQFNVKNITKKSDKTDKATTKLSLVPKAREPIVLIEKDPKLPGVRKINEMLEMYSSSGACSLKTTLESIVINDGEDTNKDPKILEGKNFEDISKNHSFKDFEVVTSPGSGQSSKTSIKPIVIKKVSKVVDSNIAKRYEKHITQKMNTLTESGQSNKTLETIVIDDDVEDFEKNVTKTNVKERNKSKTTPKRKSIANKTIVKEIARSISKNEKKKTMKRNSRFLIKDIVDPEPMQEPQFLHYVEMKQDVIMDQHPQLSELEIVEYLYKTWKFGNEPVSLIDEKEKSKTPSPTPFVTEMTNTKTPDVTKSPTKQEAKSPTKQEDDSKTDQNINMPELSKNKTSTKRSLRLFRPQSAILRKAEDIKAKLEINNSNYSGTAKPKIAINELDCVVEQLGNDLESNINVQNVKLIAVLDDNLLTPSSDTKDLMEVEKTTLDGIVTFKLDCGIVNSVKEGKLEPDNCQKSVTLENTELIHESTSEPSNMLIVNKPKESIVILEDETKQTVENNSTIEDKLGSNELRTPQIEPSKCEEFEFRVTKTDSPTRISIKRSPCAPDSQPTITKVIKKIQDNGLPEVTDNATSINSEPSNLEDETDPMQNSKELAEAHSIETTDPHTISNGSVEIEQNTNVDSLPLIRENDTAEENVPAQQQITNTDLNPAETQITKPVSEDRQIASITVLTEEINTDDKVETMSIGRNSIGNFSLNSEMTNGCEDHSSDQDFDPETISLSSEMSSASDFLPKVTKVKPVSKKRSVLRKLMESDNDSVSSVDELTLSELKTRSNKKATENQEHIKENSMDSISSNQSEKRLRLVLTDCLVNDKDSKLPLIKEVSSKTDMEFEISQSSSENKVSEKKTEPKVNGFHDPEMECPDVCQILNKEKDPDTISIKSSGSESSFKNKKGKEFKPMEEPEFLLYFEVKQDKLVDDHPELSPSEMKAYLYKTWQYEENIKPEAQKEGEDVSKDFVKDASPTAREPPKQKKIKGQKKLIDINKVMGKSPKSRRSVSPIVKDVEPRDMPKRKSSKPYYREEYSDIQDEIEMFEIFKQKKPLKIEASGVSDKIKQEPTSSPLKSEHGSKEQTETSKEVIEIGDEDDYYDIEEAYFEQLTQPKPNIFKGLIREKVCEICEKTSNLVKCKGCNGMFHVDCVIKKEFIIDTAPTRGRKKKKKPRGRKPKASLDSTEESHSDEKSQDLNVSEENMSIDDVKETTVIIDLDNFESQWEAKMKEVIDNVKDVVYDSYSSDDGIDWTNSVAGKCEIVDVKLKPRSQGNNEMSNFKCRNCQKDDTPVCFVCKAPVSPKSLTERRQKCQVAHCHKYYHLDCLDHWPQTQLNAGEPSRSNKKIDEHFEALTCPRHVCHTCVSDDPRGCKTRFSGDKLARCVRCPATYHSFTKCLPAGSQILSASHIVCPRHYEHKPGKIPYHVNTGWCFICALGGNLICCDFCPTSFHADCLNIDPPEGGYMCEDCETGRLPLYGEMVWVKLGHYRWWPGIVLHPSEIPDNIMAVKHSPGEFVVRFFGQYDHYWVNRGRVFPFQEGDSGRISTQKSKIDEAFTIAMEHAKRAFDILKNVEPNDEESQDIQSSLLPPHYVKLKVNKPCGALYGRRVDVEESSLTQCECNPDEEEPCGPYSHCLNRMLLTECGPHCRAGERCQNRAFERRQYPRLVPYRTAHRGWGLRTLEDIKAGQFVIEYVGELIDEAEFRRRMQRKHETRDENFYFLTLDKERLIDAGPKGNLARFMNHCCEPNCETQKWTVLGDVRVGLFALRDIPANTEVTFNYNLECTGIEKKQCMCGAKRCAGYIGAKPKQDEPQPKKTKVAAKRTYKKRKNTIESPSTSKNKPKRPVGRPAKQKDPPPPRELTDIEKDLLIIQNATNGLASDSDCSTRVNSVDESENIKPLKRKKVVFSTEDCVLYNGCESPGGKRVKMNDDGTEVGD